MVVEKCPDCGWVMLECDCGHDDCLYDDEVKLKDRMILDFNDVKKCLLELEERIDRIELLDTEDGSD